MKAHHIMHVIVAALFGIIVLLVHTFVQQTYYTTANNLQTHLEWDIAHNINLLVPPIIL